MIFLTLGLLKFDILRKIDPGIFSTRPTEQFWRWSGLRCLDW
ncbi:hypothetical protein CKA32_006201 [Geitlerinema sp. FC II]|nr:hypothetical protein CKA32_006201 [Geitlerinema sp. FC II]